MARRILIFLTITVLLAQQAAQALPLPLERFRGVITSTHRVYAVPNGSAKIESSRSHAPEIVKDGFQTILFIWTLAMIEVTRRKIQQDGIANIKAYTDTAALSPQVALQVLNDPTIFTGMAGAGFNSVALDVLMKSLKVPAFKTWLSRFLFFASKTLIVLVGWEFGAQLWEDAAQALPTNEEYQMSQSLGGLLGALVASGAKDDPSILKKRRVARKMLSNMGNILIMNPELRRQFIDHTMRRRIATGQFTTLAAGLIGGGIVGSLVPGAGTIVMAGFGLLGATASLLIPQKRKDQITAGIREFREFSARQDLTLNAWQLKVALTDRGRSQLLKFRSRVRNRLITALFEEIEIKPVTQSTAVLKEMLSLYEGEATKFPQDKTMGLLRDFFQVFVEQSAGGDDTDMKLFIENAAIMGFDESRTAALFQ